MRSSDVGSILSAVEQRCDRQAQVDRIAQLVDADVPALCRGMLTAGRLTVAFHPDRRDERGLTAAAGLARDGAYLPQWVTGASSGSRSAIPGGLRERWERDLFGIDLGADPRGRPIYGAFDLLEHRHGGSPFFGSCFLVVRDHVRARTTLSVGDSHLGPDDVGTFGAPEAILAALFEQAAGNELLGQPLGVDDLLSRLRGGQVSAPDRVLTNYLEAQIHGGLDLREDVEAISMDPSFVGHPAGHDLAKAAQEAGVELRVHPGTRVVPEQLGSDPTARELVGDDDYLAVLTALMRRLSGPDEPTTPASIGRLVADEPLAPRSVRGDAGDSPHQQVKHLWQVAYRCGTDAR